MIPIARVILVSIIAAMVGCTSPSEVSNSLESWAIRTNLDGIPGMLALQLDPNMYVAYDAPNAALYKVWKGDIHFTGPVHDNIHGPQPLARGEAYLTQDRTNSSVWSVWRQGQNVLTEVKYRGYHCQNDLLTMDYELHLDDGAVIPISETPEYFLVDKEPALRRTFVTSRVPDGVSIKMELSFDHLLNDHGLTTSGSLEETDFAVQEQDWGDDFSGTAVLVLNSNGSTALDLVFQSKATDHIFTQVASVDSALTAQTEVDNQIDDTDNLEVLSAHGRSILGTQDCAACHATDKAMIGPSYTMVARKYPNELRQVNMLSEKILKGGTGVWGERLMTPHPNLTEVDAKAMAAYILAIVPDDEGHRNPGVVADFYDIGQPLPGLPEVVAGQSPNASNVYANIDFRSGNPDIGLDTDENFDGFVKDFVMHVSGYLNVTESKTYDFQFIANNGGKLSIDGELITQGQFYEGTYVDAFNLKLNAGAHKIEIEFYHHLFDKYLVLLWRDNPGKEYEPIPASAFTHDNFEIKPTAVGAKNIVTRNAPGFGASLEEVHPSFDLTTVRPEGFEPRVGDLEFAQDGRLMLCTWDGQVYEMKNVAAKDPNNIIVTKIADGLCEPLGITMVNDEIYVLQRWELTKLHDKNKDGIIDYYEQIAYFGSNAQFHEWSFGLIYQDGYFYCTTGIAMGHGSDTMSVDRGKALKISMDGSYEHVAYGLKEPNGIGFGVDDEIFVAENEGEGNPGVQDLAHTESGKPFYGNRLVKADHLADDLVTEPAVIYLPQNEIGNSPSQPIMMHHGPYEGQMIHGEITHGGIKRDFIEKVKGQYQGAVFRFSQGLEVGINRMEWGPDGSLYAAGLGGAQDFGHKGHQFGLQRLTYNGSPAFEMLAIRARSNGLEIEFTKPLRKGDGMMPGDYRVQQWYYEWTHEGESTQKKELENLGVKSVTLSGDRQRAFLELAGMKKDRVYYIELQPAFLSEDNDQLWSNQGWYTLNEFPDESGNISQSTSQERLNQLKTEGWTEVFEAGQAAGWSRSKGSLAGREKSAILRSIAAYENFELELEWMLEPGSEGGILINLSEEDDASNHPSAPRFQLMDDNTEESKNMHTHKSGSSYDVFAPSFVVTKPTGQYNHSRMMKTGNHVEHWINGIMVLRYELDSTDWKAAVASSIYTNDENYGRAKSGKIGLYVKSGRISFKNVRVRELGLDDS